MLLLRLTAACCIAVTWTNVGSAFDDSASIERGRKAVWTTASPLNGSMADWKQIWRAWGLETAPKDLSRQLLERYGLHPNSREGDVFPLGLTSVLTPIGPQLGNNCLMCHASRIAGRTVIGLGNSSLDLQTLMDDMRSLGRIPISVPFAISNERGTIEASAGTAYLLRFRDAELNLRVPQKLHLNDKLREDVPAWWHRRKKKTIFHTGSTSTHSVRANLSFLLAPIFTADHIKGQEAAYTDIRNYLMSLEPPKYPFEIDKKLAASGKAIFETNCAECHGTYGRDGKYPNRILPLNEIGTDPTLATSHNPDDAGYYERSWLFAERDEEGKSYHRLTGGYQAPPLDGVWATAPYFHNASVPTIEHVLNSQSRPRVFTRSYKTDEADYDKNRIGWKTQPVDPNTAKSLSPRALRRVYDTRKTGCGNGGHTFGDHLTPAERRRVLEYLKTL